MPTYSIGFRTGAFTTVTIEADNLDQALEEAYKEGFPSLCGQCAGSGRDQSMDLGDDWEVVPDDVYQDDEPMPEADVRDASASY